MGFIDLSHILDGDTPVFPGDYPTSLSQRTSLEADHFVSYVLASGMHTGTHMDMPMHLVPADKTVAEYPVDGFAGKGVLLDVRGQSVIHMAPQFEQEVAEGSIVLLYTGFDKLYGKPAYFADHPVVSAELGEFLVARRIKILGMDMPAPDYPPFDLHKALLSHGIFVLENLTNLEAIPEGADFEVMAFPLKLRAEASLVRAVCRLGSEAVGSAQGTSKGEEG